MDRRCWMLVLSGVTTLVSLAGYACERPKDEASLKSVAALRSGDPAAYDRLIESADSPEMRKFAEDARAKAATDDDLNEIAK